MKTMKNMLMILVLIAFAAGCQKEVQKTAPQAGAKHLKNECGSTDYTIFAGQTLNWGSVTVWNDDDNIYVKYEATEPGTIFYQFHLWIGTDPGGFPKNKQGVPIPGQFPYSYTPPAPVSEYTYVIPRGSLGCDAQIYLMAHCTMFNGVSNNTGWGGGPGYNIGSSGRWYYEMAYTVTCCIPTVCEEYDEETAYAGTLVPGTPWFCYFTTANVTETLFGGQTINVGSVAYSGDQTSGTITITLDNGWELEPVSEPVKIQGYNSVPTQRGKPGQYTTYKGTSLTAPVAWFPYYNVHVDVRRCAD